MTIIRDAEITDIPVLARTCASAGWPWLGNEIDLYQYLSRGYIRCLVAENCGEVTGFVTLNLAEYWGKRVTIEELYVIPRVRNSRTAYMLVREAWKRLETTGWLRASAYVRDDNDFMLLFLHKLGWKEETALRNYDPDGATYRLFTKRIPEGFMRRHKYETVGNATG